MDDGANRNKHPGMIRVGLLLAGGLFAISMGSILVRFSQEAPSLTIAFYRMFWAGLFLLPFFLREKARRSLPSSRTMTLFAGLALALHFAFWITSLRFTTVAVSVLLVNTSPALVAVLSYFLLGERLTVRGGIGLFLTFAGSGWLFWDDLSRLGSAKGAFLALLGAAALGCYILAGRKIRQGVSLIAYVFPTYVTAMAVLLVLGLANNDPFTGFSAKTFGFLILLGLVPQALGHTSYNWALAFIPATVISTLIVAEPFIASALAWWLLGETVGRGVIGGALLVAAGIYLVSTRGISGARGREGE